MRSLPLTIPAIKHEKSCRSWNIDIDENRDERSAGFHYVKDRLAVRKKTFLPLRASSGWH
jgi:hypothetical protein